MPRRRQPRIELYQRHEGGTWYCDFVTADGRRLRRSTHQRDRVLAERAAGEIAQTEIGADRRPVLPLERAGAEYLAHLARRERAEATLSFYVAKFRQLGGILGTDRDVNTLTLADIEGYIDRRKTAVDLSTIAKELGALVAALRYAKSKGTFVGDASAYLPREMRGLYTPGDRVLTHEEYSKLFAKLSADRRDYLVAFVGLGVRDSELYRIRRSDVRADGKQIHIRGKKTKRSDRWLPLRPDVLAALRKRIAAGQENPIFRRWLNVRRDFKAACKRAEIEAVTPNDLRRTFATWLAERGVPELVVVALMGHSSSAMVRRVYTRIGTAAQTAAVSALPDLNIWSPVTDVVTYAGTSGRTARNQRTVKRSRK